MHLLTCEFDTIGLESFLHPDIDFLADQELTAGHRGEFAADHDTDIGNVSRAGFIPVTRALLMQKTPLI